MAESFQECVLAAMRPSDTGLWWKGNVPCDACWRFLTAIQHGVEACGTVNSKESMRCDGLKLHMTPAAHNQAAESGCPLCLACWTAETRRRAKEDMQSFVSWIREKPGLYKLRLETREGHVVNDKHDYWSSGVTKQIYLAPLNPTEESLRVRDYRLLESSSHPDILALARHWLEDCREHHTKCLRLRAERLADWMPTRLVHVHPGSLRLRLVENDEIRPGTSYTTLSHCWGVIPDRICLTSENIARWKTSMPDLARMKTLQDALVVTVALGVHYIWIDSLCIMQDDEEDWRQQSALMASIYKYSDCNITASAAQDDTEGCFFAREPGQHPFSRVALPPLGPRMFDSFQSYRRVAEEGPAIGVYDAEIRNPVGRGSDEPVYQRGWVIQEKLLVPRNVNFGKTDIWWECTELYASEGFPLGLPTHPEKNAPMPFDEALKNTDEANGEPTEDRIRRGLSIWRSVLDRYGPTLLTKQSDRLVAISGIARELAPLMRCRYLAGLWSELIVFQLTWYSRDWDSAAPRRWQRKARVGPPYLAPSWSWASVYSCWCWIPSKLDHHVPLARLADARVRNRGNDPFGQVLDAQLVLRGVLTAVRHKEKQGERLRYQTRLWGADGEDEDTATVFQVMVDDDDEDVPTVLYCLPLHLDLAELKIAGLALVRDNAAEEEPPMFRRVGLVHGEARELLDLYSDDPGRHQAFCDVLNRDPAVRQFGHYGVNPDPGEGPIYHLTPRDWDDY
ncbi:heterokaryon incompatibility protein-domain-containing protein [Xylariaceae sp. FL0662B]|nr:heterokaryon incompatibility protein-domain-containing protein [Xylariaceae sp. FL0662B]